MASRIYDFTLAANVGASQRMDVLGSQCKVITSPAGPIRIRTENGEIFDCLEGQGFQLPDGQKFNNLTISNLQAAANSGTVFIGDDLFVDSRITGIVQVVDGGRARTWAGLAGIGTGTKAALAGNLSAVQLWNPAGAAMNCYVKRILMTSLTANSLWVRQHNAALSNLQGGIASKRLPNNTLPALELRDDVTAGLGGNPIMNTYSPVGSTFVYDLQEPIMMPPGSGLSVYTGAVNQDIRATFDCYLDAN